MTIDSARSPCTPFTAGPVVIIDHRPAMCLGLQSIFSSLSGQVHVIDSGDAASVLTFAGNNFDSIVFFAHAPPRHDGLVLLKRLRANAHPVRLVLYGSALGYDTVIAAIRADIDGLLPESASLNEFSDCFKAISEGGKWLSQVVLHAVMTDPVAEIGASENALMALTPRQKQIAHMVAQGQSNKQIACATGLAEGTVKMHVHRTFQRLNIPNRAALAAVVGDRLRDAHRDLIERGDKNAVPVD